MVIRVLATFLEQETRKWKEISQSKKQIHTSE